MRNASQIHIRLGIRILEQPVGFRRERRQADSEENEDKQTLARKPIKTHQQSPSISAGEAAGIHHQLPELPARLRAPSSMLILGCS